MPRRVAACGAGIRFPNRKLAKKYLGEDEYPFRQPGEERVKIVIEPEKVSVGQ